jgi:hypothetical protein
MYGVDDPTGTAIMAAQEPAVASSFFQGGVPLTNTPATTITVDWLNGIQSELLNLVTAAGLTPTKTNLNQVTSAVKALAKTGPGLQNLWFSTPVSVTGGSTVLIGPSGISSSDLGSRWVSPFNGNLVGLYLSSSSAPAGSQTVSATAFINGSSSAASVIVTGSATSNSWAGTVAISATNGISVHIVSSTTAATSYISGYLILQSS